MLRLANDSLGFIFSLLPHSVLYPLSLSHTTFTPILLRSAVFTNVPQTLSTTHLHYLTHNLNIQTRQTLFLWAARYGHHQVVNRLLLDERVDPAADDNYAIRYAAENGHLQVVNRLLQDERVDPAAQDNDAICCAARYGHLQVVNRLLLDDRVDPTAQDNFAICSALVYGHAEVMNRLTFAATRPK